MQKMTYSALVEPFEISTVNVRHDAGIRKSHFRFFETSNTAGAVKSDRVPDRLLPIFAEPVATHEISRRIRSINFEAQICRSIVGNEADIVHDRRNEQQFRIPLQLTFFRYEFGQDE